MAVHLVKHALGRVNAIWDNRK